MGERGRWWRGEGVEDEGWGREVDGGGERVWRMRGGGER